MKFNYRIIHWTCNCGLSPLRVKVGVTSLGELLAEWNCMKCKKTILARIDLEKLIADIPPHPTDSPFTQDDVNELKDMHIKFE